ncbi:MAG TPA: EAL domain-containing protein [Gaiellaceae bacterium]|nr:EAL domain-containing protein [Gaiellaceae bacterium]
MGRFVRYPSFPRLWRAHGTAWFALVAMWLVGVAAIAAVLVLQDRLDARRQAQIVLADLDRLVEHGPVIPFAVFPVGGSADEARAYLHNDARQFEASAHRLAALDLDDDEYGAQIDAMGTRYYADLEEILDLVVAGDLARAGQRAIGLGRDDGRQVALRRVLESRRADLAGDASDALRLSEAGSAFAVFLTLVAFSIALYRATRSRRRALALVAANEDLLVASTKEEERYRDLFENANEPIATVDLSWILTEVNEAFVNALGYTREGLLGTDIRDYLTEEGRSLSAGHLERKLAGTESASRYEQTLIDARGRPAVFEVSTRLIEEDGRPVGVQGMCRDITARKEAEHQLRELAELNHHQANHDLLTGLPNRLAFQHEIERAIASSHVRGPFAVALIDVDRFKQVNDTLGHRSGDALLRELAAHLRKAVDATNVVARLGGDEFGVLLQGGLAERSGWADVVARITSAFDQPHVVDGVPMVIEASVGIAIYPTHGSNADELLRLADVAMYVAKASGRDHAVYSADDDPNDTEKLAVLGELRRALSERELVLQYQPILDLRRGRTTKVEALVRWNHPTRGLIQPLEFLPLAEMTGLIKPLTLYVLDEAVRQCKEWEDEGNSVGVSVNLSTRNLTEVDFVANVLGALEKHSLDPSLLTLEITESAVMADPVGTKRLLARLSEHGVCSAIDDFGAGFTSLAHLRDLPIREIKIDRSFVIRLLTQTHDRAIVRSIVALCHALGLEVVAEGVEHEATLAALAELDCDSVQGFHVGRPRSAAVISLRLAGEAQAEAERAA